MNLSVCTLSQLPSPRKALFSNIRNFLITIMSYPWAIAIRVSGFSSKLSNLSGKNLCRSKGQKNDMYEVSEFSEAVYFPPGAWTFLAYRTFSDNVTKTNFNNVY